MPVCVGRTHRLGRADRPGRVAEARFNRDHVGCDMTLQNSDNQPMKALNVDDAPAAIGPYCHAMQVGNLLFCSGQTPLDPNTMQLVGTTIEQQTARVFANLALVLAAKGLTLSHVAKTNVYLKSMDDFAGMNRVYEQEFAGHRPARTTVAVRQNPLDALVEIECIAEIPERA